MSLALAGTLLVALVAIVSATPTAEEVALSGCILGCDLNRNEDGRLTLSDYDAGELWHIDANSGVYTTYDAHGAVVDARSDGNGHIWWSDSAESFSRLALATGMRTTWVLTNFESLNGVAVDIAGNVWFSEWFGSQSRLHRFDPAGNEWCSYTYPGGGYSYFLLYDGQSFWTLNWFSKVIVRFMPGSMTSQRWTMVAPVGEPYGMAMDADGVLWWSDRSQHIFNLDPVTDRQRAYTVPLGTGSAVERLEAGEGLVWYTESVSGTVGALDPVAAASISTTLTAATGPVSQSCVSLVPLPETATDSVTGKLVGSDVTVTSLQESDGWFIYALPKDAELQGLATTGAYRWVTDMGRRKLVRLAFSRAGRLSIDMNAEPGTAYHGQPITYTYQISYASVDNSPANHVELMDNACGPLGLSDGDTDGDGQLDPGEKWLYECQGVLPAHLSGESSVVTNTATISGKDADGAPVDSVQAQAGILFKHRIGRLVINKSGPSTATHGQVITYTYSISYESADGAAAQQLALADDKCAPVSGPDPAGDANANGLLDVGEVWLYQCVMGVPEHDDHEADPLVNEATVEGQNLDGDLLESARDTHAVDISHNSIQFISIIRRV